ncbi:LUD domain-containing protein [Halobacteria archaeon AArc-curdl1]|uniref:LUD domain-containing protein n=1 Tax=Natronosalvus hydrolyticus TaxID=2979988 RepID=A0AAP2Z687_9EURY|nr:LUD domain-containing protein [Halobacteria archaeon AArc-curdl1]
MKSNTTREETRAHIRHLLAEEGDTVFENTSYLNDARYELVGELGADYDRLKDRARSIKEEAIEHLPDLIETLTERVEANGGTVYVAEDAADANQYITSVCDDVGAESVVKSKSMTTEELEVNDALEAVGIEAVETDLGEMVIQIADEAPSHLVGPGLHKSRTEIAELFNTHFDPDEPLETAEELTEFARDHLAPKIEAADVGMTGANFLIAETGSLALVTNEGNARKVVESNDTHIAVAGIEKILPTLEELQPFIELIGRSAGQSTTAYTSILTPPVATPTMPFDEGGERSFHLVLVDNGRMAMRDDEQLRETLYCIRCSACLNSCANFQHVGGHAFGGETYTGGIATGWETGVHGLESAAEFNDLCTGCSRCVNQCPVKIDIPWINTVVRDRINRSDTGTFDFLYEGLTPDAESGGLSLRKRLFGNFETLAKLGSATAPVSNWLANRRESRLLAEHVLGVDRRRALPEFQRTTFRDWFRSRERPIIEEPMRRAVLYPDIYTNYVSVERGKAAVRTLESLGVEVELATPRSTGREPLSQGMISTATERARLIHADLADTIDEGTDVVFIEPSDLAMFTDDYEKLLPKEAYQTLAENSYDVLEYVYGLLENGADPAELSADDESLMYHSHCQQRTLGVNTHTVAVLEELGYDVMTSNVECCGMAGSFGYKSEYYDLSMDVGDELRGQLVEAGDRRLVASGTSCTDQIDDLVGENPIHPIEVIDPERRKGETTT